ncbi:OmpA family protein [Phenylobacterium sp.]|uniref:OmpA family protein n=1 Tax=Phenylobacterium sp. TaxID=1871053 RepID=UPI00356A17AB
MSRHAPLHSRSAPALAAGLICVLALAGCTTPRMKPSPSPAVLETRARIGAKPAVCSGGPLASVSPIDVGFGFDETEIGDAARQNLVKAAAWLTCNPGVEVVILPKGDNHGTPAHRQELAEGRAKAVVDQLRALGATQAVIRSLAAGAVDPVTAPHLVISARGRGW